MGRYMKCFGKTNKAANNATLLRGKLHVTLTFIAVRKRVQQHCTCIISNMTYLKLEWSSESNGFTASGTKRDYKIITTHKTNPNPNENG